VESVLVLVPGTQLPTTLAVGQGDDEYVVLLPAIPLLIAQLD
jgi:hypothetical protein